MASRSMTPPGGAGKPSSFDVPVAALAGLSVAFLAYAAPADRLADLVEATGLAALIPAAAPPLGVKARLGLGGVGGIIVFAAAFLLLRWLEGLGSRPKRPSAPVFESYDEPPRLRRRDFHPDAPARRPLLACELEAAADDPPAPAPAVATTDDGEAKPRKRPVLMRDFEEEDRLALVTPAAAPPEPDAPVRVSDDLPEPPACEVPSSWLGSPVPAAEPFIEDRPRAPSPSATIDDLMERLEKGLARRLTTGAGTPIADPPAAEAGDDRLQNAIRSLQRFTAGQAD